MTRIGSGRPWRWRAGVLAVVVGAATLTGCTAVRNDLGTANSPCYVALPAARQAVHGRGRLVGVHLASVGSLVRARGLYRVAHVWPAGRPVAKVCLVAFSGHFTAAGVEQPRGRPSGHLAVVVLQYQGNNLLGTVLFEHAPQAFGHSHFGP